MSEFDVIDADEPEKDAETLLTPLTPVGTSPREQLVRSLVDTVVLPTGRLSASERSLAADILLQILDKVELPLRVDVAKRIARVPDSPSSLQRMLALDEPTVAAELLTKVQAIPEALLIEAARSGTTAHRMLIAKRNDMSGPIADVLIEFREIDVCMEVLRREEFTLSPTGINTLVAMSATKNELQPLLLRRSELEPSHGFMMFWWVESGRRKRILTRFALDRGTIQDALADLYPKVFRDKNFSDPFVKEILIFAERRHRPRGVNGEQVDMDVVLRTLTAARKYPGQEVIDAIGMIAGVSRELAARIVRDPQGESFAVLCKSLGLPRDQFFEIVSIQGESAIGDPEDLLEVFDTMARDYARAVLRYWDWDGNPRIAHIMRLLGLTDDEDDEVAL